MSGFFNKILTAIGLEDVEDEQYNEYDEVESYDEYNDYPDEGYDEYNDYVEEEYDEPSRRDKKRGKVVGLPTPNSKMRVVVFQPKSNEDTQDIIDNLRARKPVIINLDDLDIEVAQRALDFVSGAVYALSANIQKVARSIYVVTPNGVDIATNRDEDLSSHSIRSARR